MRTFILRYSLLVLTLLAVSCKDDIVTKKLYYGTYQTINKCNTETIEVLNNGRYKYTFTHQNKPVLAYEDKYQVETDKESPEVVHIVLQNWKHAVNPNYTNNILNDCKSASFDKAVFDTGDVAYFRLQKEDESFFGGSGKIIIKRHPDFAEYDFKKK